MARFEQKPFEFIYKRSGKEKLVTVQVPIPLHIPSQEFSYRLIEEHKLPFFVKDDLLKQLEVFVLQETDNYYSKIATELIAPYRTEDADIDTLVKKWSTAFKEEHADYVTSEEPSEESSFPFMYHTLIHSPALDIMLHLEHTYALQVGELIEERDNVLQQIEKRQSEETETAVQKAGIVFTDTDITELAAKHFKENQNLTDHWEQKIECLKTTQKKEFREWVKIVYEDYKSGYGLPDNQQRIRALSDNISNIEDNWMPQAQRMEESFTIYLGSQLKVMHNLRLLSSDVMDLCKHKLNKIGGIVVPQPQRLQTAISLYSNNLSGLVLLVDDRINSYTGIKREFAAVCQLSTEFHFLKLEDQLEEVRKHAREAAEQRLINGPRAQSESNEKSSVSSENISVSSTFIKHGDFYITRHSNLSEVHVVFHLVTDDSLRQAKIDSRHPIIQSLRKILRVAHESDICTITIPLLLANEMSEEMTIKWCMTRAELVFRTVQGFMIEMVSLVGKETRTVQFLVPKGISEELFSNLSTLLLSIFRVSNPLVLTSR